MIHSAQLNSGDLYEQVQINLGPNVGDITLRYDPPRRDWVILLAVYYEEGPRGPRRLEDGGS